MTYSLSIPWGKKSLSGTIHNPSQRDTAKENYPLIIICHGFIGNRIGVDRLFVKAAKELIQDHHIVVRFDYSGCGESDGEYGKTGLKEIIEQTKAVIDFTSRLPHVDTEKITLLGHSLGGAVAILTAARDPRIENLILWAPVGNPLKDITTIVGSKSMNILKHSPFIDYQGYHLYKEFFYGLDNYFPMEEANSILQDVLLIHGSEDEDIPASYCHQYYNAFCKRNLGSCSKKIIEGAHHTFSNSQHFEELISMTRKWLSVQNKIAHQKL